MNRTNSEEFVASTLGEEVVDKLIDLEKAQDERANKKLNPLEYILYTLMMVQLCKLMQQCSPDIAKLLIQNMVERQSFFEAMAELDKQKNQG